MKQSQVRRMVLTDIDQVYEIEQSLFSMPWSKQDFESSYNHPQNLYLVVEREGEILGYCGLWAVLEEGQITNVAVKKSYQGQGIGKQLMKALVQEGKERGLTQFTLEVRESNESAKNLYLGMGFQIAGIRPNFYEKPTENAIIMWLYF